MKNLLDEKPTADLHGRLRFSRDFVGNGTCQDADILDIGCGFGWFERFSLDNGVRSVTGVEPVDEDLETARRGTDDARASFVAAGATELPFGREDDCSSPHRTRHW
jgi:SAM-dependent methyltransferase